MCCSHFQNIVYIYIPASWLDPYPAEMAPTRIPDRVLIIDASSSSDILKLLEIAGHRQYSLLGEQQDTVNTHYWVNSRTPSILITG